MKKTILAVVAVCCLVLAKAQTVSSDAASGAARQFINVEEPSTSFASLALCHTFADDNGIPVAYVFNIDTVGFVIVGARMDETPIVGYSLNGAFDISRIPSNLKGWLANYVDDIYAIRHCSSKSVVIQKYQAECQKQWKALADGSYGQGGPSKGVNALVASTWDQGYGYNNLCPVYPSGYSGMNGNGRSCTGCVATAMAQIIRYHRYPSTGYASKSYTHGTYGMLSAQFDSANYNYDNMPNSVSYYSSAAQKQAVSLLCYHCGIAVEMDYEGPNHTTGSGAHSENVPQALKHFGYTNSYYKSKSPNTTLWDSLLKNDINNSLPVYYSGSNSEGGHAFICDGYRDNGTYHFNFGWSGYGDGYYTVSDANGFSSSQGAVFNIFPSNFGPFRDRIYIDAEASGHGSSWSDAYPDIEPALQICGLYKRGTIWVKNGVYYGNTATGRAFSMQKNVKVYGGFNGTEESLDDRDLANANTVMSGDNKRMVVYADYEATNSALYNMIVADGRASTGSGITIKKGIRVESCTFENNTSTAGDGAAVDVEINNLYNCIVRNNVGGGVHLSNSKIYNSLIVHNDGYGIWAQSGTVDGCDVVCNSGVGINNRNNTTIRNCIVWRNDSSLYDNSIQYVKFSAIEGFGDIDSMSNIGISRTNRSDVMNSPFFIDPDTIIGPSDNMGDWRLSSLSPLVDAGDTLRYVSYEYDLDGNARTRAGRTDIGCYEHDPYVDIDRPAESSVVKIYPNPAGHTLNVESAAGMAYIYDAMGRCIMTVELPDGHISVDISRLPQGLYLLRTSHGAMAKIIKQ